jgi:hypothetical protein
MAFFVLGCYKFTRAYAVNSQLQECVKKQLKVTSKIAMEKLVIYRIPFTKIIKKSGSCIDRLQIKI